MRFRLYSIFFIVTVFFLLSVNSVSPWYQWNNLEKLIRDGKIDSITAQKQMRQINSRLVNYCSNEYAFKTQPVKNFVFPVENHTHEDIGGIDGNGYYNARRFDFYSSSKRASHTAHDIFVYDNNFDGKCDFLQEYVNVVAVSDGIVVSINVGWTPEQTNLRGGNYVWVFNPRNQEYQYYAHLHDVYVGVGYRVVAGQKLGNIGRSGLNAYKKNSITHLHFAILQFNSGLMTPRNPYQDLRISGRANALFRNMASHKTFRKDHRLSQ